MEIIRFQRLLERESAQEKADDKKDQKEFKEDKKNALTALQSKELDRQKKITDMFENSNKGKLKSDAVKELAAQIEKDDVRYEGFPEWVLKTWMDSEQKGAIPLLNNRWLDVKSVVSDKDDDDFDIGKRTYAGIIVNHARKEETGIKAINLLQFKDFDTEKMRKLLTFERAAIEAQKLIDRKNKRTHSTEAGGMQTAGATPQTTGGSSGGSGGDFGAATGGTEGGLPPAAPVPPTGTEAPATGTGTTEETGATTPVGGEIPFDQNGSPDLTNVPTGEEEEEETK